jgi:hypothetical protein
MHPAHLFAPQLTYRVRRNNNTDTPLPPEEPAGQNPPDGAMIDYWSENAGFRSGGALEIIDAATGQVVATFPAPTSPSSQRERIQRSDVLGASGANVVGERRDAPFCLGSDLSSARGADARLPDFGHLPRHATLSLGRDGAARPIQSGAHSRRQELYAAARNPKMDPRVKTSPEDLRRQFELDRKIADALHRDYEALQQVRSLRAQLKGTMLAGGIDQVTSKLKAIKKAAMDLDAKAAPIEGEEGDYATRYLSTPEGRSLARLNNGLNTLVSALDSADAAPTTQQSAMFVELEKALEEQLSAWSDLKAKDIPALNEKLKKAGQPLIDLLKPVPGAAGAAQTTSQDRDKNEE